MRLQSWTNAPTSFAYQRQRCGADGTGFRVCDDSTARVRAPTLIFR